MESLGASDLVEEALEVACPFLAAGPELETLVEDWHSGMVDAIVGIARRFASVGLEKGDYLI